MRSRCLLMRRAPSAGLRNFSTSTPANIRESRHFINGQWVNSKTDKWFDLVAPATGKKIGRVPEATPEELKSAVDAAQAAFKDWSRTPITQRVRTMFEFRDRVNKNMDKIAANITEELGKVKADALGDVIRGLEIVEHATTAGSQLLGETQQQLANGLDVYSMNSPLGVCTGVCPFNFPAMIPLWMFPMGIVCGNTYVIKPSEKDPGAMEMLAELGKDLWPAGVLNVVHGSKPVVDYFCDAPEVKAISFVGGGKVGNYIHERGSKNGKRVQSNMAAKNHAIILPDAQKERTLDSLVGAAFGATGQRCMALSVAIFVGEAQNWIPDLVQKSKGLRVGPGEDPNVQIGPVVTPDSLKRIIQIIDASEKQGGKVVLDGRGVTVSGFEGGNYIGATIIDQCNLTNSAYTEEIFGPVLTIIRAETLDQAIQIVNSNPFGNGSAIFTSSGAAARKYVMESEVGQIGVNLPIPVPPSFFSFTGSKASFLGADHFFGKGAFRFYTQRKTIMQNWWADDVSTGVRTAMPVHGRESEIDKKK